MANNLQDGAFLLVKLARLPSPPLGHKPGNCSSSQFLSPPVRLSIQGAAARLAQPTWLIRLKTSEAGTSPSAAGARQMPGQILATRRILRAWPYATTRKGRS